MQEQLKNHIDILNTELDSVNQSIDEYKLYLKNHKHLNLDNINSDLKDKGRYQLTVLTSDMSFIMTISNYSDYGAIFNNMDIDHLIVSDSVASLIELEYQNSIIDVLKSIAIKDIYHEKNDFLLRNLDRILANPNSNTSNYSAFHSLNAPSVIYKGDLAFKKVMAQTKKSVAKDWLLIKASEFITHDDTYNDCWVGMKSVTLRKESKKVFFEISKDPAVVIEWLASSLALRDPTYDQMLFEIHKDLLLYGDRTLIESINSLMDVNNPIEESYETATPSNVIDLNELTSRLQNSIGAESDELIGFDEIEVNSNHSFNENESINPYTLSFPEKFLDSRKKEPPVLFQLSDFNHSIAKNDEDKFRFEGWLIAYFDTKDMATTVNGVPVKWVEYFLFESEDSYYLTKIKRSRNKRNSGVVKSYKINNLDKLITRKLSGEVAYKALMSQLI